MTQFLFYLLWNRVQKFIWTQFLFYLLWFNLNIKTKTNTSHGCWLNWNEPSFISKLIKIDLSNSRFRKSYQTMSNFIHLQAVRGNKTFFDDSPRHTKMHFWRHVFHKGRFKWKMGTYNMDTNPRDRSRDHTKPVSLAINYLFSSWGVIGRRLH